MIEAAYTDKISGELLKRASSLRLNTLFIDYLEVSDENIRAIKESLGNEVEIYAVIPMFTEDHLAAFPDAGAVELEGKSFEGKGHSGVCPTHTGVKEACLKRIDGVLGYDIDGVWLDSNWYPVNWGREEPEILDTCYCDRCLELFEQFLGEPVKGSGDLEEIGLLIDGKYYIEWLNFKAGNINSLVDAAKSRIYGKPQRIKLGVCTVPWKDDEYGAGIIRLLGQDLMQLGKSADILSPYLYHKKLHKPVRWIKDMIEFYWTVGVPFLPFIEVLKIPEEISVEEYTKAAEFASMKPSMGVARNNLEMLLNALNK